MTNKETKKVNEECDLGVGFDNTFKADNHILFIVLGANGMIGWIVWNIILREANVLKIYKTLMRRLCLDIKIWEHSKKSDKNNKEWKISYREKLKKLGLTILLKRRMKSNLIET